MCQHFNVEVQFVFCEQTDEEEIQDKFLSVRPESSRHTPPNLKAMSYFWMTSVVFRGSTLTTAVKSSWQSF